MGLTLPDGIEQDDLLLDALEAVMVGDAAFFSLGAFGWMEMASAYLLGNSYYLAYYLAAEDGCFAKLGELAEMPGKVESKVNRLKTRNYLIAGRRNSSIELVLNGLSPKQKDYFESALFSGREITILRCKNELLAQDVQDSDNFQFPSPITVFNGMRWTADWNAEADGLWSVVLSTEMSGATKDRIWARTVAAYDAAKGETPPWEEEE